ncbi:aromatic ring-hydroxylating dioxygenase subunit alpha [Paraburkholderia sp. BR10882]|uniref:aromatic ring-hydroxylating dioxygenase subunit alpha n=1 Tax=unclassified Paraburkholderia TaxID=2615204 RepID=UPI0034CF7E1B
MGQYRDNPEALRRLVQDEQVHRDVYLDEEVFALEMERLWSRAWVYVGHDSQVPQAGDFITADIAGQPVIMVRQPDGTVKVLRNRCAHKGTRLVSQASGNVGRFFRCPYHAWTYKTDGALLSIPLRQGYEGTSLDACPASQGMGALRHVASYRGFVFARLADDGPAFHAYFGEALTSIDNMADRAPEGELEVAGGVLRYTHDCNWKMFIENLNDTMHPMVAHESSAGTARQLWAGKPQDEPLPMAIEQLVPFTSGYAFSDEMGVRVFANGHSYTGVGTVSLHANYVRMPEYEERMAEVYGVTRAAEILATVRHNTVFYPSLTIKGAIQAIRVVRPVAPGKTIVESWTFRPKGAPEDLLRRTLMYTRLINSPMSVVGHDDLHAYRAMQEGLRAGGNEWVSLHRNFDASEVGQEDTTANGTSEISMRNQFRAWARYMSPEIQSGDKTK